jgi:hypothetical protein
MTNLKIFLIFDLEHFSVHYGILVKIMENIFELGVEKDWFLCRGVYDKDRG